LIPSRKVQRRVPSRFTQLWTILTYSLRHATVSSSGEFGDVVLKSFDVVGRSTGPTVDYRLDVAYDDYLYETS
jgi:hypothetical protein